MPKAKESVTSAGAILLQTTVTPALAQRIKGDAERDGLSVAAYIRMMLVRADGYRRAEEKVGRGRK